MGSVVNHIEREGVNPTRSKPVPFTAGDYLVFFIAFAESIQFNIVGILNGTDISFMFLFSYFVLTGKLRVKSPLCRRLLLLGFVWLGSQILTDVVRHTPFSDYARGWSNIALTLINFATMCTLLYGRPRRLVMYGWGLVIGVAVQYVTHVDAESAAYPWKMGFSYPVTLAVALLASRKTCRPGTRVGLMLGIGLVNLLLSARNAGGCCLAAAIYLLLTRRLRERSARGLKPTLKLKVALCTLLLIGFTGIFSLYGYLADSGYLGEESKIKYEEEASGKYGVLLGGRAVMLSSIPAIIDSPILGHGSWAKDPTYIIAGRSALSMMGYKGALNMSREELVDGLIPAHSFLLGAWVYAGVFGAIFWGWVWLTVVRSLTRIYPPGAILLPLMVYFAILLSWDILFSPFGLDRRNQVPYYLMMVFTYYEMAAPKLVRVTVSKAKKALRPALNAGD